VAAVVVLPGPFPYMKTKDRTQLEVFSKNDYKWGSNPCMHQPEMYSGSRSQQSLNAGWL